MLLPARCRKPYRVTVTMTENLPPRNPTNVSRLRITLGLTFAPHIERSLRGKALAEMLGIDAARAEALMQRPRG